MASRLPPLPVIGDGFTPHPSEVATDGEPRHATARTGPQPVIGTRGPPGRASQRHRTLTRAARAWKEEGPHAAWDTLHQGGLDAYWPEFLRQATTDARERFQAAMDHYSGPDHPSPRV